MYNLIQGIPEVTGFVGLVMVLTRQPLSWKKALAYGTVFAIILFAIREIPGSVGYHTLVGIVIFSLVFWKQWGISLPKSVIACVLSVVVMGLVEYFCTFVLISIIHINPEEVQASPLKWCLMGIPQAFVMILLAELADWGIKK
ncbi:MAG: hypothetical protein U9N81_06695 [Bacillota bacterium]|nr:hypothetical protein [Bacillota bacterium]